MMTHNAVAAGCCTYVDDVESHVLEMDNNTTYTARDVVTEDIIASLVIVEMPNHRYDRIEYAPSSLPHLQTPSPCSCAYNESENSA